MQTQGFEPDQLEAIQIISKLSEIQESLKRSDKAFLNGWKNYILKNWTASRIGKYRLKNLQAVAKTYSIDTQMSEICLDEQEAYTPEASFFEKLPLKQRREVLRKQLGLAA